MKRLKMKPYKVIFLAVGMLLVFFILANNIYHTTKIKDPLDPRFDFMAYRFEDHMTYGENEKVIKLIFPAGTPKQKVELLLVDKLGAEAYVLAPEVKSKLGKDHTIVGYKIPYNPFLSEGPPWKAIFMWPLYTGGRSIWIDYDSKNQVAEFINVIVP